MSGWQVSKNENSYWGTCSLYACPLCTITKGNSHTLYPYSTHVQTPAYCLCASPGMLSNKGDTTQKSQCFVACWAKGLWQLFSVVSELNTNINPNMKKWLGTALLAGQSWDRFPVVSLAFTVTYSFQPHDGPGVDSAPTENEYQEHFLEDYLIPREKPLANPWTSKEAVITSHRPFMQSLCE